MKALLIISAILVLAIFLKTVELFSSRKAIRSVGSKSNRKSRGIARIDLNNPEEVRAAVEAYKNLVD